MCVPIAGCLCGAGDGDHCTGVGAGCHEAYLLEVQYTRTCSHACTHTHKNEDIYRKHIHAQRRWGGGAWRNVAARGEIPPQGTFPYMNTRVRTKAPTCIRPHAMQFFFTYFGTAVLFLNIGFQWIVCRLRRQGRVPLAQSTPTH